MIEISLKAARTNANMTQKEVAEKLNVTTNTVCKWETGQTEPKISQAKAMSELYGVPLDSISFA